MAEVSATLNIIDNMTAPMMAIMHAASSLEVRFRDLNKGTELELKSFSEVNSQLVSAGSSADALGENMKQVADDTKSAGSNQEKLNKFISAGAAGIKALAGKAGSLIKSYMTMENAGKVMDMSDELVKTKARLDMMNDGLQTTEELQNMIYQAAQNSRGAYQSTAASVGKLGVMAGNAFSSTEEIVAFTEQLNKQFAISGTSVAGIDGIMQQLTQSMGAGVLSGGDLNAIFDQAPSIVAAIADYLDMPIEKIKELAEEGGLTSDIVKNAMFTAADETDAKLGEMPLTFAQSMESLKNESTMAFQPILEKINEIVNSEKFQELRDRIGEVISEIAGKITEFTESAAFDGLIAGVSGVIYILADVISWILDAVSGIAQFASENWSWLSTIIYTVVGAMVAYVAIIAAYKAIQLVSNVLSIAAAGISAFHAGATLAQAAATTAATAAQYGFNIALLANPLTWIILVIVAVIVIIAKWVKSVGGIKMAWMIVSDKLLTVLSMLKIGFFTGLYFVMDLFDKMKLKIATAGTAVANFMGDMKADVLMTLQNLVNGAIDILNTFITKINKLPFVEIGLIEQVSFGTSAKIANNADKQRRNAELQAYEDNVNARIAGREQDLRDMEKDAAEKHRKRMNDIDEYKLELQKKDDDGTAGIPDIPSVSRPPVSRPPVLRPPVPGPSGADVGFHLACLPADEPPDYSDCLEGTEENTGNMNENLSDYTEEDLKLWRDIAERDVINQFTTAQVSVSFGDVNNNVSSDMDLDGIADYIAGNLEETLYQVAEGAHYGI